MPRTVKEIVHFKLNKLQRKIHCAQRCVDKLYDNLECLPTDINSLNLALDSMLISFDEFVAHFDEVCPGRDESVQTQKKAHMLSTQNSSTDNADNIQSRVHKLEEAVGEMKSTIHGGGDGEGSPHRGILSHLSVLENSFNEGKQKLISMEQKVQDVDSIGQKVKDMGVKYASVVDEMRVKTVKEDQQNEMENISFNKRIESLEVENVGLAKELKNFEGKFKKIIDENDSYKQRLICVEDTVKSVSGDQAKKVDIITVKRFEKLQEKLQDKVQIMHFDIDASKEKLTSVEDELKTVKGMIKTKEDQEKESENNSLRERVDKLEEKSETAVSDTDSSKDRLKQVEDQLKAVKLDIVTSGDQAKELDNIAVKRFEKLQNKVEEVVSDTDASKKKLTSVEDELKTVKGMIETKQDQEKESENNCLRERVDNLEEKLETTVSDTDSSKDRLKQVEDQLKAVEPIRGADLDSSTKIKILERLSVLENHPVGACQFQVWLKHDGPWRDGAVIRNVKQITFNYGNVFQEQHCRFLAPIDGIYCFVLRLFVPMSKKTAVHLMNYDTVNNEWKRRICVVRAHGETNDGGGTCDVSLTRLSKGEAVRARVDYGSSFDCCIIEGWLISPIV